MFLCRGARSAGASSFHYCNFAGSAQGARNTPPDAIRTLHNFSIISCSQVPDEDANSVYVVHGALQEKSVKSNTGAYVPQAWTAYRSVSKHFALILPSSWSSDDRNTNGGHGVCFCTDTGSFRSPANKLVRGALLSAEKDKHGCWMKREPAPATQLHKVWLSTSPQGGAEKPKPEEEQNKRKALKKIFKEYGAVGVAFHVGISIISLGIFYIAVSSGIDMTALLCKLGFSESVVQSKMATGTSTFVLAYAVHKLFAPVRISITLVSVPLIVRYFRKTGLFKPSPPRL